MPSLHRNGVCLLHLPRTGGTSIAKWLGNIMTGWPKQAWHNPVDEHKKPQVEHFLGVIRNPWDRVVSEYHRPDRVRDNPPPGDADAFRAWLWEPKTRAYLMQRRWSARSMFADARGEPLVYAIRFENLEEELRKALDLFLKVPLPETPLPHLNGRERAPTAAYFQREEDVALVGRELCGWEVERYGYEFPEDL